jgi:hypothetical protein
MKITIKPVNCNTFYYTSEISNYGQETNFYDTN